MFSAHPQQIVTKQLIKNSPLPVRGLGKSVPKSSIQKLELSFQVVVHVGLYVTAMFVL